MSLTLLVPGLLLSLVSTAEAFPSRDHAQPLGDATCLKCHGNRAPESGEAFPKFPNHYSMDWKMFEFESTETPPFIRIPEPHQVIRGKTYYDWTSHKMVEIYENRCIDIFPDGTDFPCRFLSDGGQTFFIKYPKGNPEAPGECCRWTAGEFFAPRPDVLGQLGFDRQTRGTGEPTVWRRLDTENDGPFGYGVGSRTGTPKAFWFAIVHGWAQQEFVNFSAAKPDARVFERPLSCLGEVPVCPGTE